MKGVPPWMMMKGKGAPWGDSWMKGAPSWMSGKGWDGDMGMGMGMGMDAGWAAPAAEAPPAVLSISVDPSSQLPMQGFAPEAPAVSFDKNASIFSNGSHILSEIGVQVEIDHDAEWTKYPEVAQAVQQAGGEENCIAVAKCPSHFAWAVGLGAGWQGRERAAKVAICLALASVNVEQMTRLAQSYPDFGAMCVSAGLLSPDVCPPPAMGGYGGGGGSKKRSAPADWGPPAALAGGAGGDCPPIFWIEMPPTSSVVAQGLPPTGLVLLSGGSPYKQIFSHASSIYHEIVGMTGGVTIVDDPDWKNYPDVAETIKATPGGEENCIALAYSELAGIWAVGLASGKKPRLAAVQMAISLAYAQHSPSFPSTASSYPEFASLCEAAGIPLPEGVNAKRRATLW